MTATRPELGQRRVTSGPRPRKSARAAATYTPIAVGTRGCACGGGCPRCQPASVRPAQTILSQSGDGEERDAERLAERMATMPQPEGLSAIPGPRGLATPGLGQQPDALPAHSRAALRSPGQPLDEPTREWFEARLGVGLAAVRVHTGSAAARSAALLNARAYAVGAHLVFGEAAFAPGTTAGRRLLAHELSHVLAIAPPPGRIRRSETAAPLTRAQFDEAMGRFGIRKVYSGTREQQARALGVPVDALAGWTPWDPGASSSLYNAILDGFNTFATAFGGTPPVMELVFLPVRYVKDGDGKIVKDTSAEAMLSAGMAGATVYNRLTIFSGFATARRPLPFARSEAGVDYPVMLTVEEQGAPVPPADLPTSQRRDILHELGHGALSTVRRADLEAGGAPQLLESYARAVGWTGIGTDAALFDAGVAAVRDSLANGTTPDAQYRITKDNWNAPKWAEQPMTEYSVSGGPGEDFADSVMAFIENPGLLNARAPLRYSFIEAHEAQWRQLMVAPQLKETPPATAPGP